MNRKVLSVRKYKIGYEIRTEEVTMNGCGTTIMRSAYTPDGNYIGTSRWAHRLIKLRGIKPELIASDHNICSIGFCEEQQKWFGWSHRALCGFGIGNEVKPGDCAYVPSDKEDFLKDCVNFWKSEHHIETAGMHLRHEDGTLGVQVNWKYDDKVKNKKLRKTISGVFTAYPDEFGRGSWKAGTLEDAKQMAIDFANEVS